jgi:hypothetical protein
VIELVDRRAPQPRRRTGLLFCVLVLLVIALAAHAQPITYEHLQGRDWHGETFRQGTVEDTRIYHNDGRQEHCHSYMVGDQRYTTCQ